MGTESRFLACCLSVAMAVACILRGLAAAGQDASPAGQVTWKLKYTDDFKGTRPNPRIWQRIDCWSRKVDWINTMSLRPDLVTVKGGVLRVIGVRNNDLKKDDRSVLTGGIMTKDLFAMRYGKVEFRVKFQDQKGAWPAIWMMPQEQPKGWPHDGEIDIVERLNSDSFVYQTVHSGWTQDHPNDPPRGGRGAFRPGDWNVFGLEWTPERIAWTVNGKETHHYSKQGDDAERWPWTTPFYLMIDMQLGGAWVGAVDENTLPVEMQVDWVKFYHGYRDGKCFSEFSVPKVSEAVGR